MCVDYTDLNKACSKDSYPLPSIDRLVDALTGHTILLALRRLSSRPHPLSPFRKILLVNLNQHPICERE